LNRPALVEWRRRKRLEALVDKEIELVTAENAELRETVAVQGAMIALLGQIAERS
jgi:hypothetical protein